MRPVAIAAGGATLDGGRLRAGRIGIPVVVTDDRLDTLADAICADDRPPTVVRRPVEPAPVGPPGPPQRRGRRPGGRGVGAGGSPGRTTLAAAVAAEIGRRRRRVVLVDADPYGGAVAQQLGILDEVSGLLAAVRLDAAGQLEQRLGSVQRGLDQHLSVVTGLPRADRWVEVRSGTLEHLLALASAGAEVVVDTGFSLEEDTVPDLGGRPGRNQMTLEALDAADEVLVVGGADPVGLSRLARGAGRAAGAPQRAGRSRSWSTGCAPRSAGPSARSSRWCPGSPGPAPCTSCPTTSRRSTARWSPGAPWSRAATPTWAAPWPGSSTGCCPPRLTA